MGLSEYRTAGGVVVERTTRTLPAGTTLDALIDRLDQHRGVVLDSDFEYPGRHRRWAVGFVDPPLVITARDREVSVAALNERGRVLLAAVAPVVANLPEVTAFALSEDDLRATVREAGRVVAEDRGAGPSVFTVLRAVVGLFAGPDPYLGLYGAFGYDLVFQVDELHRGRPRPVDQRDLVLYLPDELTVVDPVRDTATRYSYDFRVGDRGTHDLPREGAAVPYVPGTGRPWRDHAEGEYAEAVRDARESFRRGDLFEVVLSQAFGRPSQESPATLYRRLRARNSAPYSALLNLGQAEYLVSSSPAMYTRVRDRGQDGWWVETCPISGTASRGADALRDADQILGLLSSAKDTSELTMCTDVDRNDKSLVCEPGTVEVVGRRQIELYSDVMHTVDHIMGRLAPGRDAIDAFLAHMWAVTVTGAPKLWAMRFVEEHERTPRRWYGGATGWLGFDGQLSTGLTLRTLQVRDGTAVARAGATLLFDSDPAAEERETELKAGLFLDVLAGSPPAPVATAVATSVQADRRERRVVLVDHEDSFVHTLGSYLRQVGADVTTLRAPLPPAELDRELDRTDPDLLVLSPGPGRPEDFDTDRTIDTALDRELPVFGVCLGLQALVEYFGGKVELLPTPVHGKQATVRVRGGRLFRDLPSTFEVGRYHSLHAPESALPDELMVTAETDGVVMAVEHRDLPIAATQFHPESVLTGRESVGLRLLANMVDQLTR